MELEKIFHMKEGLGKTSYAKNSSLQRTMITRARSILHESIRGVYNDFLPQCLMMADFGCSLGPNSLMLISDLMDVIDEERQILKSHPPQFGVFLNDLPGNDFNAIYNLLLSFYQKLKEKKGGDFGLCFISGIPKSYGRVFPDQFLHFAYSSYSIHWLSQVPKGLQSINGEALNMGNTYITNTSPPEISQAYYSQFKKDFTIFLRSRAKEIVSAGRMVLTLQGSINRNDPDSIWELLGSTLHDMVLEGKLETEKLDKFNMPFYAPTLEEVRNLVESEGSFYIKQLVTFNVDWSLNIDQNLDKRAEFVANTIRAVSESLLVDAFGEAATDDLFLRFKEVVKERMAQQKCEHFNLVISLIKRD